MAEEVAKLKATIEIDSKSAQNSVNIINQRIDTLNKKMQEGEKLTAKENAELKRLVKTLADLGNSANKTQIAEEKMRATREKSANEVKNKSIINEQKLATEREKTRKATTQAEQAELRLAKQKDGLNKETNKSSGLWSTLATRFTVAGLAVNTITGLFNNLKQSIQQTSQEAINFQKDLSMVNTLSNLSKKDLEKVGKELINMGTNMGRTPEEMAKGMYAVKSITDDTVDSMKVLETATKASVAMTADLSGTVDTGVGVINAYGMEIENLEHVYDVMFKTTDIGNVTMEQLNQHLGNVVSSAVRAKVPFETLMGQLAFMTKNGIETAEATTALARAYDAIYQKNGKMKELFNIDVADPKTGKLKDTMVILEELSTVLKGYDEISQINLLDELGIEIRGQKAVQTFIEGIGDASYVLEQMSDNAGAVGRAFEQASDNIATATIKNQGKIAKAMNDFRIQNEKTIIKSMELWTNFKLAIINTPNDWKRTFTEIKFMFKDLFTGATGKYAEEEKEALDKIGESYSDLIKNNNNLKDSLKDSKIDIKKSLNESSDGFKDWAGDLKGYFQNVMNNSSTMAVEVAKNMLATITAFQTYSKSMPKAKAKGLLAKDARLQGYSEDWIAENVDKPLETLYSNPETISILQKVIAGGGKLKSLEDVPSGKGSAGSGSGGTTDTSKPITLKSMKDEYETEISNAKTYAKERGLTEEELQKNLLSINDSYGQKALEQNKKEFTDWSSTLFNNANAIQDSIDMTEMKNKAIEDNSKNYEEMSKDSEDYFNNMIDNFDKEQEAYDKTSETLRDKILAEKENANQYQNTIDEINSTLSSSNNIESLKNNYEELIGKFSSSPQLISKINEEYDMYLEYLKENGQELETFSDKLSASASFVSELSSVLDNEFLSSLANAMNGISSMSSVIGNAGGISNLGFGGWASIATSSISIAGTLSDMWSGDGGVAEKQEAADQVFEDAVETFKTTVENYSTKEKIDYANLTKPSSLSEVTSGIGNGDVGWGASDAFDIFDSPDDATYDISNLKNQLTKAGYVDLAGQLDSIMGKYAQYGRTHNWYGGHESYISGYDTTGFLTEVNALIEEAYQTNLDAYKEQVGLASDSFVSAIKEGMENATALDISSMIESAFYDSYSAMIVEVFGENIGDTISETMFDVLENAGVNQSDLANMSVSEQIAYIQSLMDNSSTYLSEVFEQLGLSASKVSEEFDKIGNRDMPSLLKIGVAEVLASNTYNNSNTVVVQNAYGTIDRQFVNLTNKAVGSNMYSRTGN